MDNSNNQNLKRYIHAVLAKLSASGGGGGDDPSSAKIEFVDTLPTASADTVGIFYVVPNPDGNTGTIHITQNDGSTYSWVTVRDPETANVQYTQQTLTAAQKQQARNNIDAASLADIENLDYVTVTTLPTASAETMGHVYLIGPDSSNNYQRYYTQQNGSSYSWVDLGSTQLDLSTYATEEEVSQLQQEVTGIKVVTDALSDPVSTDTDITTTDYDGTIDNKYLTSNGAVSSSNYYKVYYKQFTEQTTIKYSLLDAYVGVFVADTLSGTKTRIAYYGDADGTYTVPAGKYLFWDINKSNPEKTAILVSVSGRAAKSFANEAYVDNKFLLNETNVGKFDGGYYSTYGTTIPSARSPYTPMYSAIIPVTEGKTYRIYGDGATSDYYRLYALYDANGNRTFRFTQSGDFRTAPVEVTIPAGTTQMVVNFNDFIPTDRVVASPESVGIKTMVGDIDSLGDAVVQKEFVECNRQRSDIYSPILVDWMQFSHMRNGMTDVSQMQVISSTANTLTLTQGDASAFHSETPAVVGFSDGTFKVVYFSAYPGSGTEVTRASYDSTDLTDAVTVQSLHDTVEGGAGIHLSPSGYLMAGQFTAQEVVKKMSQKHDNLIVGMNTYFCSLVDDVVYDANGNAVCTISGCFTNGINTEVGNNTIYNIDSNLNILAFSNGWLLGGYDYIQRGVPGIYQDLTFKAQGKGFIEVQAASINVDQANYTGRTKMEVIVDGTVVFTTTLLFNQTRYQIDNVDVKGKFVVRLTILDSAPTAGVVYSVNFWRMPSFVPAAVLDSTKKIAVLGDSWTQFPTADQALGDHSSFNEMVERPNGTTGEGYGYFPKELARLTGATVDNWGKGGTRADNWGIPTINELLAHENYDYVVIEFFVNDNNAGITTEDWANNIVKICQRCIAQGARPIVIVPCMDNGGQSRGAYHEYIMRGLKALQ